MAPLDCGYYVGRKTGCKRLLARRLAVAMQDTWDDDEDFELTEEDLRYMESFDSEEDISETDAFASSLQARMGGIVITGSHRQH